MEELELQEYKERIDNMSQENMANLWRFAPIGSPYFDESLPLYEYFTSKFHGFTCDISKNIGWKSV